MNSKAVPFFRGVLLCLMLSLSGSQDAGDSDSDHAAHVSVAFIACIILRVSDAAIYFLARTSSGAGSD